MCSPMALWQLQVVASHVIVLDNNDHNHNDDNDNDDDDDNNNNITTRIY